MTGTEPAVAHRSVISKVVAIQRSLEVHGALTVTEIAQATALPLSTTHRIVGELADWQVLHRDADGRYRRQSAGGTHEAALTSSELRVAAGPTVTDLGSVTGSDVRLGVLQDSRVWYVEKAHGPQPLTAFSPAATLPVHATAIGQVLLAFSPAAVARQLTQQGLRQFTPCTITEAAGLDRTLRAIRLRGVAVAAGQLRPDHAAVAAPVFGPGPAVVAALEVRLHDDVQQEARRVVAALAIAVRGLSRQLGHAESTHEQEDVGTASVLALDDPARRRRRAGSWGLGADALSVSWAAD